MKWVTHPDISLSDCFVIEKPLQKLVISFLESKHLIPEWFIRWNRVALDPAATCVKEKVFARIYILVDCPQNIF